MVTDRTDLDDQIRKTFRATGLEPVQARTRLPGEGWRAVVESLAVAPENLHWRAVRHALVASYDHWDRPVRLDALLQRQLGDRARRDAAARAPD